MSYIFALLMRALFNKAASWQPARSLLDTLSVPVVSLWCFVKGAVRKYIIYLHRLSKYKSQQ